MTAIHISVKINNREYTVSEGDALDNGSFNSITPRFRKSMDRLTEALAAMLEKEYEDRTDLL